MACFTCNPMPCWFLLSYVPESISLLLDIVIGAQSVSIRFFLSAANGAREKLFRAAEDAWPATGTPIAERDFLAACGAVSPARRDLRMAEPISIVPYQRERRGLETMAKAEDSVSDTTTIRVPRRLHTIISLMCSLKEKKSNSEVLWEWAQKDEDYDAVLDLLERRQQGQNRRKRGNSKN